jgi:hypothetical protein
LGADEEVIELRYGDLRADSVFLICVSAVQQMSRLLEISKSKKRVESELRNPHFFLVGQ